MGRSGGGGGPTSAIDVDEEEMMKLITARGVEGISRTELAVQLGGEGNVQFKKRLERVWDNFYRKHEHRMRFACMLLT